jgi:outer membrane protein with beta-barrel domain
MQFPSPRAALAFVALSALLPASAGAADVQLSPFVGLQYGGSFGSVSGRAYSVGAGLAYGGTVDVDLGEGWGLEFLYSRQETDLSRGGAPSFDLAVERYMGGVREEKGEGPWRAVGVFLVGATRFAPGLSGFGSDTRFTASLGLGGKLHLSEHFGLRAEARGYYVVVQSGGGALCSGSCLFVYSSSGVWQGDVTAGVIIGF